MDLFSVVGQGCPRDSPNVESIGPIDVALGYTPQMEAKSPVAEETGCRDP